MTLVDVTRVDEQVQAPDGVATGPVIRIGGGPTGAADADSPEF
jgi:hypothetical protein